MEPNWFVRNHTVWKEQHARGSMEYRPNSRQEWLILLGHLLIMALALIYELPLVNNSLLNLIVLVFILAIIYASYMVIASRFAK